MAFAESEFALTALQDDGQPLRAHLNSLWRQTGEKPQLLEDAPELPAHGAHLWRWFIELHAQRGNDGMKLSKITARDMIDWCWCTGNTLDLWERQAIRRIDAAWLGAQA